MTPISRRILILSFLNKQKHPLTVQDIQNLLHNRDDSQISKRQIQRDLLALSNEFPITTVSDDPYRGKLYEWQWIGESLF